MFMKLLLMPNMSVGMSGIFESVYLSVCNSKAKLWSITIPCPPVNLKVKVRVRAVNSGSGNRPLGLELGG